MCLIVCAYQVHPEFPLIIAANRDEFRDRPTRAAEFWPDQPDLLGGRDLSQGGTWLGLSRQGRLAMVTNYRNPHEAKGSRSRGLLVSQFLQQDGDTPSRYFEALRDQAHEYSGFNLLAGGLDGLYYYTNRSASLDTPRRLQPGLYGLSNHLLDTSWPKVARAKTGLQTLVKQPSPDPEALLELLRDPTPALDACLPDTGVGLEWERLLSPIFIEGQRYGTRASTIVLISRRGETTFIEQTYDANGPGVRHEYRLRPSPGSGHSRHGGHGAHRRP